MVNFRRERGTNQAMKYMGDFLCYCGHYGKLEMDIRRPTTRYQIQHFKRTGLGWSDHNSKLVSIHYIGDKFKLGEPK